MVSVELSADREVALKHFTKSEAAEMLALSPRTIDRLVEDGQLAQIGIGRRARFTLDDLREYQERSRVRGPGAKQQRKRKDKATSEA